jgi:hypothetical protein
MKPFFHPDDPLCNIESDHFYRSCNLFHRVILCTFLPRIKWPTLHMTQIPPAVYCLIFAGYWCRRGRERAWLQNYGANPPLDGRRLSRIYRTTGVRGRCHARDLHDLVPHHKSV